MFPLMGFNIASNTAIIYDSGTEHFTGTTLHGIGQSVAGVLQNPAETANRFVMVRSIKTCQNEILEAFESATGKKWAVRRSTTKELFEEGRRKKAEGDRGWVLDLVVGQLFDVGVGRCVLAGERGESDSGLLGVGEETVGGVVAKALRG